MNDELRVFAEPGRRVWAEGQGGMTLVLPDLAAMMTAADTEWRINASQDWTTIDFRRWPPTNRHKDKMQDRPRFCPCYLHDLVWNVGWRLAELVERTPWDARVRIPET